MPLVAKLVVVGGDVKTNEIALRLPSTIGRGKGTNIVLQHPLVSRQHCELFETDGQLMVRDLGSLNGTFVNNQRITESPLPAGELLTVGTVTFRAVYEPGAADEASPQPSSKSKLDATTLDVKHRGQKTPPPAADDAPLEFDFGQPLRPGDLVNAGDPDHPTEQLDATLEDTPRPKKDRPRSALAKPAPAAAKTSARPADDSDAQDADDDDDLNDFLKNLGAK